MTAGLLPGCNLANYESAKVRPFVEVEEVSEERLREEAALLQDADGSIRAVIQQEFEVQRVEVSKEEVTRTVHDTKPLVWLVSEVLTDPLLFTLYLLSPLSANKDEIPEFEGGSSAALLLLPLPGITYAPALSSESREHTSTRSGSREVIEPRMREEEVSSPSLRVLVDGVVVPSESKRVELRQHAQRGLSSGDLPLVTIEYEGREHQVEMTAEMACASVAALSDGDVPWLRAIEYQGLIYGDTSGTGPFLDSLRAARAGESGRWMAEMERSDWRVITSESKVRMPDGAVVDFRGPVGPTQEQSAGATEIDRAEVEVTWPDGPMRGEFSAQVTVSNTTGSDFWQVVVVLDSPGTGLYPVPIGRVPAGGSIRRFIPLTANRFLEALPRVTTHLWREPQEGRPQ
ncbi:hypothetical protein OAQ71_00085 [bacterium]|nr:hypothetical protein [bacterium]